MMMVVVAKKNNSCNCISNARHRDPLPQLPRNYLMYCTIALRTNKLIRRRLIILQNAIQLKLVAYVRYSLGKGFLQ